MNDRVRKADELDEKELETIKERIHSITGCLTIKEDKSIAWKSERADTGSATKKRKGN